MIERSNPLSTDLWRKPQTNGFHEFILLTVSNGVWDVLILSQQSDHEF